MLDEPKILLDTARNVRVIRTSVQPFWKEA
jgi:hypothetical protein